MTTVPPPTNPALPQVLAAALAPTATIANPPAPIAALPPGATLTGTVSPGPDPRTLVLATANGDVPLRTPVPLPDGAELTVEVVRASQAQVTVRLVTLDGQALQQALAQAAKSPLPQTPAPPSVPAPVVLPTAPGTPAPLPVGQAWWPTGPQPLTALPQLSAYVLSTGGLESKAALTTPQLPAFNAGSELGIRVTSLLLPDIAAAPTPGAATPATPPAVAIPGTTASPPANASLATGTPALPGQSIAATATPQAPAAPQSPPASQAPAIAPPLPDALPVTLTPTSATPSQPGLPVATALTTLATPLSDGAPQMLPQQSPGPQTLILPNAQGWPQTVPAPPVNVVSSPPQSVITGTVIASPDGVPVIQTPDGNIQLNVRANLPVGAVVTFEVTAHQPPSVVMAPPLPAPAILPLSTPTSGWPTLIEAVTTLQRSDPAIAAQFAATIPDGSARSALAIMSFVQALRSGEPRQWPGDGNLRALERTGPRGAHLATQIAGEVSELSRQVRETPGEWRALPIPWQADGRVERIRLVLRETDPDAESEKRKKGGGTRFLIDLTLSQLGALQLDGMFKKDNRTFDMMVRTYAPLPEAMRTDLAGVFANANAAMNLAGSLSFQVVKKFPDPLAGPARGGEKSGLWA